MFQVYTRISIMAFIALSYEYAVLNRMMSGPSLVKYLQKHVPFFKGMDISTAPGHPISYWLGWVGFGFMLTLLIYSIRKRFDMFRGVGALSSWLDFHIFCGMIGPILILFHCNFEVGGLVAISFWSMCISAGSGIVGRYFYFEALQSRGKLRRKLEFYDQGFKKLQVVQRIHPNAIEQLKRQAIATACGVNLQQGGGQSGVLEVLFASVKGDIALWINPPKLLPGMHRSLNLRLREYAKIQRRVYFMDTYKKFMGYWHAFHLPFAIFMYIVALIHVVAALLFQVNA